MMNKFALVLIIVGIYIILASGYILIFYHYWKKK